MADVNQEAAAENRQFPGTFEYYRAGLLRRWYWRYRAANGEVVFRSTDGYTRRIDCISSIPRCSTVESARRKAV